LHKTHLTKPDGRSLWLYAHRPIPDGLIAPSPNAQPVTPSSHLRWHPLRGEWVAYASHRQNRTFLPPPEWNPLAVMTDPAVPTELPPGPWEVAVFENLFPTLSGQAVPQLPPGSPPAEAAPPAGPAPPPIAAAEYDPNTGTYVGPDGQIYTQANLARGAAEEQTWQTMLLPPMGN